MVGSDDAIKRRPRKKGIAAYPNLSTELELLNPITGLRQYGGCSGVI